MGRGDSDVRVTIWFAVPDTAHFCIRSVHDPNEMDGHAADPRCGNYRVRPRPEDEARCHGALRMRESEVRAFCDGSARRPPPTARSSRESRGERPHGAGRRALEWQRELPDRLIYVGEDAEKARPRPDLLAFVNCRQSGTPSAKVSSRFSKVVVRSRSRILGTTMRSISFPKTLVGSSVSMIPTSVNASSSTSS